MTTVLPRVFCFEDTMLTIGLLGSVRRICFSLSAAELYARVSHLSSHLFVCQAVTDQLFLMIMAQANVGVGNVNYKLSQEIP